MTTPITDRIFADAYDQAMPENGEGWDIFADRIKLAMQGMEDSLRDTTVTKREYFAAKALQGMLSNPDLQMGPEVAALEAVTYADSLISTFEL